MAESVPEASTPAEAPKPGSLGAFRTRLVGVLAANARGLDSDNPRDLARTKELIRKHNAQLNIIEALAAEKAGDEVNQSGEYDQYKVMNETTADEAVTLLERQMERWDPQEEGHEQRLKDAEDLRAKLFDEASRAT